MRFSRLRLNGFKSFVDPTDLVIAHGLTGVVGPNGCGKSNLLEALRWVMGENRAKSMRGDGMEDVIFAGAATRGQRNFAEVSLTVENSDRLAPSGFNDSDWLEVTRRITRDAGSAYKVNTKDVRARDVQMLFADASTGAHSPALVRQGQISELINARPKARRRILEEAAGISGLYQRRHEAELKLKGAETNLARVDDVIETLAAQITTLARQARQAARYREIGVELRTAEGKLLYRRYCEADAARVAAQSLLVAATKQASEAERLARAGLAKREKLEAALTPLREEEAIAGAVLQRLGLQNDALSEEAARATDLIATLTARLAQLERDSEREVTLNRDAGDTIARLEWEARELDKAGEGHADKLEKAAEAARSSAAILQQREAEMAEMTEDVARLAARHQSVGRMIDDITKGLNRAEAEAARTKAEAETATQTLAGSAATLETAQAAAATAQDATVAAEAALVAAETARAAAQTREADARAARSTLEGEGNALRAEAGALARMLDRDGGSKSQLIDALKVADGFEKALGAALGDDLNAGLMGASGGSGWGVLPPLAQVPALPVGAVSLADHVTAPPALARRLALIGVVAADAGAALQAGLAPGQRLVSKDGDLWRWDGFCQRAADAPSAAALRLQQLNRLERLKAELVEATAKSEGAAAAHDMLRAALNDATAADTKARDDRRRADARVSETLRAVSGAEAAQALAASRLEQCRQNHARFASEIADAQARLDQANAARAELADLDAARAEVEARKIKVEAARITMLTHRSTHDDIRREGEARVRRSQEVAKDMANWRARLDSAGKRISDIEARTAAARAELATAEAAPALIHEKTARLADAITQANTRQAAAAKALQMGETARTEAQLAEREAERLAGEARENRARAEARVDAARDGLTHCAERIREAQDMSPTELAASLGDAAQDQTPVDDIEVDVNRLKRLREALGAVNLRAEEDAREVTEEHATLVSEKSDLEAAIRTLRTGIASLNREGRERLLTAFEQVNENFAQLFKHLFGGGEARLELVESDDPLDAGLEIMCQPPGKKLSNLGLLSGGEQTLTAMALIFAVFLANPAPICVLDEVDAPLDDANVTRFCDLLDEMTRQTDTRFLVITHHAVTMARMDRLFGVTMQEQGVSQLVSVDLKKAEAMVA